MRAVHLDWHTLYNTIIERVVSLDARFCRFFCQSAAGYAWEIRPDHASIALHVTSPFFVDNSLSRQQNNNESCCSTFRFPQLRFFIVDVWFTAWRLHCLGKYVVEFFIHFYEKKSSIIIITNIKLWRMLWLSLFPRDLCSLWHSDDI